MTLSAERKSMWLILAGLVSEESCDYLSLVYQSKGNPLFCTQISFNPSGEYNRELCGVKQRAVDGLGLGFSPVWGSLSSR